MDRPVAGLTGKNAAATVGVEWGEDDEEEADGNESAGRREPA